MGHQGSMESKISAIENLDRRVIAPIKSAMDESKLDYRLLILPDHPTPVRIRTHTSEPVPYIIYDSRFQAKKLARYNEKEAAATGHHFDTGYLLMDHLLHKD